MLKKYGTTRNDFDPPKVIKFIQENKLSAKELKEILYESCNVIIGLRADLHSVLIGIDVLRSGKTFWLNSKHKGKICH